MPGAERKTLTVSAAAVLSAQPFPHHDVWPYLHQVVNAFGPQRLMWGSDFTRLRWIPVVGGLAPREQWHYYSDSVNYLRDTNELSRTDKDMILRATGSIIKFPGFLAAYEEKQDTSEKEDESRKLPAPFIVLATDNPIEYEGTYELPEAQLDRFLMRLRLGYLSTGDETAMLSRRVERAREEVELGAVTSAGGVLAMRETLEQVEVTPDLLDYIVAIVGTTRRDPQIQVGASPRGGLALVQLARGQALLSNRDYVVPDDIKQVAVPALAHRLTLRPELWVRQVSADDVMAKLLSSVPTPSLAEASSCACTGFFRISLTPALTASSVITLPM